MTEDLVATIDLQREADIDDIKMFINTVGQRWNYRIEERLEQGFLGVYHDETGYDQ